MNFHLKLGFGKRPKAPGAFRLIEAPRRELLARSGALVPGGRGIPIAFPENGDGLPAAVPAHGRDVAREAVPLGGDQLTLEAANWIRKHTGRLEKSAQRVNDGDDEEAAHDLRVAVRRLRSVLEILFETEIAPNRSRRLGGRLKELGRATGALRDSDVLIESFAKLPDDSPAKHDLRGKLLKRREKLERELRRSMKNPSYNTLYQKLEDFAGDLEKQSLSSEQGAVLLRHRAGGAIWHAYETVIGPELRVPLMTIEELHELRIAARKLRFKLEFFEPALGPRFEELRTPIVLVQDYLGAMHDCEVAAEFARAYGFNTDGDRFDEKRDIRIAAFRFQWPAIVSPGYRGMLGEALRFEEATDGRLLSPAARHPRVTRHASASGLMTVVFGLLGGRGSQLGAAAGVLTKRLSIHTHE